MVSIFGLPYTRHSRRISSAMTLGSFAKAYPTKGIVIPDFPYTYQHIELHNLKETCSRIAIRVVVYTQFGKLFNFLRC